MKFVMSYSCGKDSSYALYKMIEAGHEPVGLLVMVNQDMDRSWFHGADYALLDKFSKSLELPLILCPSKGEEYHLAFEDGLRRAMEMGAETACFGDIDIEGNRQWSEERCRRVGIKYEFPLWQQSREEIVRRILDLGFKCVIKNINNEMLPDHILGKILDDEVIRVMEDAGIDICGENGEFHTTCVDGPVFKTPLPYELGEVLHFGNRSVVDIR